MSEKNRSLLVAAVLALIIFSVWLIGNQMATRNLGRNLERFAEQYHLQKNLHWKSYRASTFGGAYIKEFTFTDDQGRILYQSDRVDIKQWSKSKTSRAIELVFNNVTDAKRMNPLWSHSLSHAKLRQLGYQTLPALNIEFKLFTDNRNGETVFNLGFNQPELFILQFNAKVRDLQQVMQPYANVNESLAQLLSESQFTERLAEIPLIYGRIFLTDSGFAEHARDHADKASQNMVYRQCLNKTDLIGMDDGEFKCQALVGYASGDFAGLALQVEPSSKTFSLKALQNLLQDIYRAQIQRPELGEALRGLNFKLSVDTRTN